MAGSRLGGWIEPFLLSPPARSLQPSYIRGQIKSASVEPGFQVDAARV